MKKTAFIHCLLLVAIFLVAGCNAGSHVLEGWNSVERVKLVIKDDCRDYIRQLSEDERNGVLRREFYQDKTGQFAVRLELAVNGVWWVHILIYDQNFKRIKVIRYRNGRYAC